MKEYSNRNEQETQDYWNKMSKKGNRDAEINQRLKQLKSRSVKVIFNKKITTEKEKSQYLKSIKTELNSIFQNYNLPKEEKTHRINIFLKEQEKFLSFAEINAYGLIDLNSVQIYKIIRALKANVYECEFEITPNGIKIHFIDSQNMQFSQITIQTRTFQYFQSGKIGINLNDFSKILKAKKSEKSNTTIIFTEMELKVIKKSPKYNIPIKDTLSALDLEREDIPIENLSNLKYPVNFKLSKKTFKYLLKHINIYGENINIKVGTDDLIFSQRSQSGNREIILKKEKIGGIEFNPKFYDESGANENENCEKEKTKVKATANYPQTNIQKISKIASLLKENDIIDFFIKTDHPLLIQFSFPLLNYIEGEIGLLTMRTYIASKNVQNER